MKHSINTKKIEQFILDNGYSNTRFAKLCKISHTSLAKVLKNEGNFSILVLFKIARVMQVQIKDLFD